MFASLVTGVVASLLALVSGAWAALALRAQGGGAARTLGVLFFVPSAVPSVSVGLGLLVAFSQPPLLLNGTTAIVFIAHFVLISAFSFGNVSAGLARVLAGFRGGRLQPRRDARSTVCAASRCRWSRPI